MNRVLLITGIGLISIACLGALGLGGFLLLSGGALAGPAGTPARAAVASCEGFAVPADEIEEGLSQSEAVDLLSYDLCAWDAVGMRVPVPRGWSVEVLGRISPTRTSPGDLGALRMHGTGPLEEISVTVWARGIPGGQPPSVLYPNPWLAILAIYDSEAESARESALAGRRTSEALGKAGRRPVVVNSYYAFGRAWSVAASSDERSSAVVSRVLERIAAGMTPAPATPTAVPTR